MKRVVWMSNHPISADQQEDLRQTFGADCLVFELPQDGKRIWGNIPPDADFYAIELLFWEAFRTIHTGNLSDMDAMVIMGELSICLAAAKRCVENGVSLYTPTTRRESREEVQPDGSVRKTNIFRHVQLRCLHDAD